MIKNLVNNNTKLINKLINCPNKKLLKFFGIKEKTKFILNPLVEDSYLEKFNDDESFAECYHKAKTAKFLRYLLFKAHNLENLSLAVFSKFQRSGKSGVGNSINFIFSRLINYNYSVRDIFANQNEFLDAIPKRPFNSCSLIDETTILRSGLGSHAAEEELEDIIKITAKQLLHTIQIYRNVPHETLSHYALEPIAKDGKTAQTKCLLFDLKDYEIGYMRLLGYVVIPHYDKSIGQINHFELKNLKKMTPMQKFRLAYENKKDAWNKSVKYRTPSSRSRQRIHYAQILRKNQMFQLCKKNAEYSVVARQVCPKGFTEDELREIIMLAKNKNILDSLTKKKSKTLTDF